MSAADPLLRAWTALAPDHAFPPLASMVDAARQARYHAALGCAVDFQGQVNAGVLAQDAIRVSTVAGMPNDGRIHVDQTIVQHRPVRLGEKLVAESRWGGLTPAPRGQLALGHCDFRAGDGSVPVAMTGSFLLPGPSAIKAEKREPERSGLEPWTMLRLTPDGVRAYSAEVGNRIHFDPAFAQAHGFRAPVAQGLMQACAILGALGPRPAYRFRMRFLRPVFWDDVVGILADRDLARFLCLGPHGKPTAEATLD
ncbi:MAG: hypothetical protein FJX46_00150 [Alphaproteobacteria bacterium]|nr:hypothetical protein [Alphaproteobacteria bacterium]